MSFWKKASVARRDQRAAKDPVDETLHKRRANKEKNWVVEYYREPNGEKWPEWLIESVGKWIIWKRYTSESRAKAGFEAMKKHFGQHEDFSTYYHTGKLSEPKKFKFRIRNVNEEVNGPVV